MNNKIRLPAFTIMELTIAMLLSAIVIGITYTAYTITARSYARFHRRSDTIGNLTRVNELLMKDFSSSDSVFRTDSGIIVNRDSTIIRYEIDSNMVIRKSFRIDTFKIDIRDIAALFEGQTVIFTPPVQEADRIDELSFTTIFDKQKIPYHYHKDYSSVNLSQRKAHALN